MSNNLYNNIRTAMVKKNLTQADMAKMLGISEITFNRKMNDRANWTLSDVHNLMEMLDLTFEEVSQK